MHLKILALGLLVLCWGCGPSDSVYQFDGDRTVSASVIGDGGVAYTFGSATPPSGEGYDFWLATLNMGGELLSEAYLGGDATRDFGTDVELLENGDLILLGNSFDATGQSVGP